MGLRRPAGPLVGNRRSASNRELESRSCHGLRSLRSGRAEPAGQGGVRQGAEEGEAENDPHERAFHRSPLVIALHWRARPAFMVYSGAIVKSVQRRAVTSGLTA